MRDQLDRIITKLPGQIGLYMKKLNGESYAFHADEPFEAASVIKLPIMVEAFRQFAVEILTAHHIGSLQNECFHDSSPYSSSKLS